jgi:hypothetical protein
MPWKRSSFRDAIGRQDRARHDAQKQDEIGCVYYDHDEQIKECLNALLSFTERR